MEKNPPVMQETSVPSLGWEDPLEKGMATQYSCLKNILIYSTESPTSQNSRSPIWASLMVQMAKKPPAIWETWVQSLGWEDSPGEGKGYPLQYSGLEDSMDYSPWGRKESDMTFTFHFHSSISKLV